MKNQRLALFDSVEAFAENQPAERTPPQEILLVRFGGNKYTKNGQAGEFEFSEADADSVIAEFATRGRDIVIDYEHQSLQGGPAPAAGWIASLRKNTDGLVAQVKYWTEQASALLRQGEYRYFSPVLLFSRRGKSVSALHSVALTNHPAMHHNPALVAADNAADAGSEPQTDNENTKGNAMHELLQMLGLLALADASADEQWAGANAEIGKLLDAKKSLADFLELHDCATLDELNAKFQAMVPSSEKARLEEELRSRDAANAVAGALRSRKISAAFKDWATEFAKRDLKAFKAWSDAAPAIVPDNADTDAEAPSPEAPSASEAERAIFRRLGLSDKQIDTLLIKEK